MANITIPGSSPAARRQAKETLSLPASAPVKFWALLGAVVLAVMASTLVQWFVSDHFHPAPVGLDPISPFQLALIRGLEIAAVSGGLVLAWYTIVRPWRRDGELSWDGMLYIVALSLWFQDPIDNYFNFAFSYNAYFVNMTSWAPYLPGWESPKMENFPEPLLLISGMYTLFLCGGPILGCAILRKSRSTWLPNQGQLVHIAVCYGIMFVLDLIIEVIFCRNEIFGYGGTYHPLTLWAGEYYQFPLYESMCVAGIATTLTCLRYFKDDKGYSFAEKGVENLRFSKRGRKAISFLAIMGFAHVAMFVVFFFPFNWFSMKADSYPKTSSYMRYEVCGQGTDYACPSREVPVPSKKSLAIGPNDPRLSAEAKNN